MLPFLVSKFFGAVHQAHGMALVDQEGIRLVFHEGQEDKRPLDAKVDSVLIEWANLDEIQFRQSFFGDRVTIRVTSADALGEFPGLTELEVTLETQKSDREKMDAFQRDVDEYRSGRRTDEGDDDLDGIRDFLRNI